LESELDRTAPKPRDLARLRREIEVLDRKIDNAETAVLDAPTNSRSGLYRKLEELNTAGDRLKAELTALASRETTPARKDGAEVEAAIDALRTLGEALRKARPGDTKELLSTVVVKIELHFDHSTTEAGRTTSEFSHGDITVRPDIGGGWSFGSDSTPLNRNGSIPGNGEGIWLPPTFRDGSGRGSAHVTNIDHSASILPTGLRVFKWQRFAGTDRLLLEQRLHPVGDCRGQRRFDGAAVVERIVIARAVVRGRKRSLQIQHDIRVIAGERNRNRR
jgi:hypothetical protein